MTDAGDCVSGAAVFCDLILDTFTCGLSLSFVQIDALTVFVLLVQTPGSDELLQAGILGSTFFLALQGL